MKRFFTFLLLNLFLVGFVSAQKGLTILLVHDSGYTPEMTDSMRHAIKASGYTYSEYDAVANGAPAVDALTPFELVIWLTGDDQTTNFWAGDLPNDGIKAYLDAGGMLWLEGIGFMDDLSGAAPATYVAGDFAYDYLGISAWVGESHYDDGVYSDGVPQMDTVGGNGICTIDPVTWRWSTMYSADAVDITSTAKSIYKMGPEEYDLGGKTCMVYNEIGDAKILTALTRWDGFNTPELKVQVTTEILDYFGQFSTTTTVFVTSIEITSASGFTITENNGELQLGVTVLPEDATNKTVTWSIGDGSVDATIDQTGLLTASGYDDENGIVHVIATANDASGVTNTVDVTISNQALGEGYRVLLVNDNANDRYLELDTALDETGYIYKMYFADTKGESPSVDLLNNFDFVIWYTGNDASNLYFWDVSDSSNFKCNAALKTYADNGGVVWLQGLDFLYDIYGAKYTAKNAEGDSIIAAYEEGDFVYDYLGIKEYVAQSHANDGVYSDGVPHLDIDTENNDITTLDPIGWVYTTMWYVDALAVTENAKPLYYLGPETYDFALYYAMLTNKNGDAEFITSPFETARLDNQENTNQLFKEVLDYYEGLTTSASEISELGSLELSAYPNPAKDKTFITYSTSAMEEVNLTVYDITGKVIQYENLGIKIAGNHTYELDLSDYIQGVYFYQISTANSREAKKIIVFE